MQPSYRPAFAQQPQAQRSPHAAAASSRRGIGPMVGQHPQGNLTQAQLAAQHQAQAMASDRAKLRSRKPTDKNLPDGVEDCVIGDGVQQYKEFRELERKLDATMMRKRLDIQESVNRNVKSYRTLRIWISNTVEDQPWQADTLDVDAFDFSTNIDSSYRVKLEGRLLDNDESPEDSESEDEEVDGVEKPKKPAQKQHKLSHFFKAMTVDFDKNKGKDGAEQNVEWKKPSVAPNVANPPTAADFDQIEFKRGGDENQNITINLTRDENPERFELHQPLVDIMDVKVATRAEVVMGIWQYIKANGLQEEDEKRAFDCDDKLKVITQREKGYIPYIPEAILNFMQPLPPIKLPYTIRVDKEFHENPQPTIYDVRVQVDDPVREAFSAYLTNPEYANSLREIASMNDHLALLVQKISNSKSKHTFFDALSKNPTDFIAKWLSSQKRDLEVIAGVATRGGNEDAKADEWRKGGSDGVWGSDNVKASVGYLINQKMR